MQIRMTTTLKINPDYSQFLIGDFIVGKISFIEPNGRDFFVIKDGTFDLVNSHFQLNHMWWIPTFFESFILNTDEGSFRATRLPMKDAPAEEEDYDPCDFMKVFLLDVGETHFMAPAQEFGKISLLPDNLKELPGLAIKCRCNKVEADEEFLDISQFLKDNIYKKLMFEVINVMEDSLEVNILPYDDLNDDASNNKDDLETDPESLTESEVIDKIGNRNSTDGNVILDLKEAEHLATGTTESKLVNGMTPEELATLDEIPESHDNALIAAQGFVTRDDENLCQFYDPAIGGCFKKGSCKQRHIKKTQDCRDRQEVFYDKGQYSFLPKLHSSELVKILKIVDVNILTFHYVTQNKEGFEALDNHMNKDEIRQSFVPFKLTINVNQLVIVKASNDRFCRGRIESIEDEQSRVKVFLVDFGIFEEVTHNCLYNWDPRFDHRNFQSFLMEIVNIERIPGDDGEKARNEFLKHSNETFTAVVFENVPTLKCKLYYQSEDFGMALVEQGLAKQKNILPPITIQHEIPG